MVCDMAAKKKKRIPKAPNTTQQKQIPLGKTAKPIKIRFGFAFFHEREYFGLGGQPTNWFVTLLKKLKELSRYER